MIIKCSSQSHVSRLSKQQHFHSFIPDKHSSHPNSIDFNLNYDIANKTLWASEFMHIVITVEDMVKHFVDYKSRVKVAFADSANKTYFDGYVEYHRHNYLLETLTGEGNIAVSTTLDEMEQHIKHPDGTKMSVKISNLNVAFGSIFPNCFEFINPQSKVDVDRFTPQFIKELHAKVMNGLVEEPGTYRTKWAKPSQEEWVFVIPQKIDRKLNTLCKSVRTAIKAQRMWATSEQDILVQRIKIMATFLTEFLQIHPFSNGNGRVARLLISWLMADVVPLPLLTSPTTRDRYLQCLRDARHTNPILPISLARFVLESVVHTMGMVCVSLDI